MEELYILCVDDQRDVLNNVSKDLRPFSSWAVVDECESAREAAELLDELDEHEKPVALIICDHIMPDVHGVDFLASLAGDKRFPLLKKVLLTGLATHKDTIDAVNRAHIDAYIEKPWKADELQSLCRRLLTEYLFDSGRYSNQFKELADPEVVLARLR